MQDVARLAGVSVKTVSNVVNDFPHVSEATRQRVADAIAKLGYQVNHTARNLRTGRTGLITLALPELKLPYFAELADSVIGEATRLGLRVLVEQTNGERQREIEVLHGSRRHMTDGLIFSPLALESGDVHLFSVDFPIVLLGERVFGALSDHITMSNTEAARQASLDLLSMGRRRIALLGVKPDQEIGSAPLRQRGHEQALEASGLAVDPSLLREVEHWHRGAGAAAMDDLIASGVDFDAVFALNDTLAMGALHSLHEHGIDVPADVAVVGFDDIEDCSYAHPTLSSVSPGREEIARLAVELLHHRVGEAGTPVTERKPYQRIHAPFRVIHRESTAVSGPSL